MENNPSNEDDNCANTKSVGSGQQETNIIEVDKMEEGTTPITTTDLSTKVDKEDKMKGLDPTKPLEQYTKEDVQRWLMTLELPIDPKRLPYNGKTLADFTKEDLVDSFSLDGAAIFNAAAKLKGHLNSLGGWIPDLTTQCVEPNPGPAWKVMIAAILTKTGDESNAPWIAKLAKAVLAVKPERKEAKNINSDDVIALGMDEAAFETLLEDHNAAVELSKYLKAQGIVQSGGAVSSADPEMKGLSSPIFSC